MRETYGGTLYPIKYEHGFVRFFVTEMGIS